MYVTKVQNLLVSYGNIFFFNSTTLEKSRVDFVHEQSLQTCAFNQTAEIQH